jgi:hypothetical protein
MDQRAERPDTVQDAPTLRDVEIDDTDVHVIAPRRATTEVDWPPTPERPAPTGPEPRRAAIFRAITESKLR